MSSKDDITKDPTSGICVPQTRAEWWRLINRMGLVGITPPDSAPRKRRK